MKCINFDGRFAEHTSAWVQENAHKFATADDMEEYFPNVYEQWLHTPASWLDGCAPADYFTRYDDARQLVTLMREYFTKNIPVPDLLLDRISDLGEPAAKALLELIQKPRGQEDEAKLCAVSLLTELECSRAFEHYIKWIVTSAPRDDLAERAAEAIAICAGEDPEASADKLLLAYSLATPAGRDRLLDILARIKDDERILKLLIARLGEGRNRGLYASYLQRYGDERALPALKKCFSDPQLSYLDYIELRNAIEYFGETVTDTRDFSGDAEYEAMKNL